MKVLVSRKPTAVAAVLVAGLALLPFARVWAGTEESAQTASPTTPSEEKKQDPKAKPAEPPAKAAPAKPVDPAAKKDAQKPAAPAKPVDPKKAPVKDAAKKPSGEVNTIEDIYAEPQAPSARPEASSPQGT